MVSKAIDIFSSDSYFTGVFAGVTADVPPEKTRARGAFETRGIVVKVGQRGFEFLGSRSTLDLESLPFENFLSCGCQVGSVCTWGVNKHMRE